MSMLHQYDEQEFDGIIDFFDKQFPTTVWFPGDDGSWELCVLVYVEGVRYFDDTDLTTDPGTEMTITIRRRRLRLRRKWKIIDATLHGEKIWLRPATRR